MSKKKSNLDEYVNKLRRGEGLGVRKDYIPWLSARTTKTKGVSSQTPGIRTGRDHHLLSTHEKNFLYIAEYNSSIIDIREQFPLLPLDLAIRISEELGIRYPLVPRTNQPIIITTDFLLTLSVGPSVVYKAVSIKPEDKLKNKRDFEKQEIERVWWELLGVDWSLYLDTEQDKIFSDNLKWLSQPTRDKGYFETYIISQAIESLSLGKIEIAYIVELLSKKLGIELGFANELFRYLAWNKHIELDMSYKIPESGIVKILKIHDRKLVKDVIHNTYK